MRSAALSINVKEVFKHHAHEMTARNGGVAAKAIALIRGILGFDDK